ncbi:purple acid phosphatase family protein [Altericroceibacterium endophyticum]|uniref:Metallophosphoesterase n=1 Tax=Altericroceibacterium endophyticum TaxID=1808508 RepID=A0A6I4TAX9_9SPHN|nr:metallophosphoesterase family protein [Altericroceibacterium endophyticum]MXO67143.1 metallophosphoesterase [Altericroceibacterium endophyticum]
MKKLSSLKLGAVLFCAALPAFHGAPVMAQDQSDPILAPASVLPERIILNLTQDTAHEMAITWRSAPGRSGQVQYAEATAGPDYVKTPMVLDALTDDATFAVREDPEFSAAYHSATLTGLKPGTVYAYRVGDGAHWSEWFQFRTGEAEPEPFRFIYLGDMQNNVLSEASRTLRMAFRQAGDAAFVIHAGDLINRHNSDIEWGEWFASGGFLYAQTPQMPTPGNHEYGKDKSARAGSSVTGQWRRQFTLPENGPAAMADLAETNWYTDYQGLRLISVDSMQVDRDPEARAAIIGWLDGLLAQNPNHWTVIFLHFPLFSSEPDRDNPKVRAALKPLIDKYGVDLVLQGHDHGYARGAIGPNGPAPDDAGATYAVSVAGPKMYPVAPLPWARKSASHTQAYQVIDVSQTELTYRAFTATGEALDEVVLKKPSAALSTRAAFRQLGGKRNRDYFFRPIAVGGGDGYGSSFSP